MAVRAQGKSNLIVLLMTGAALITFVPGGVISQAIKSKSGEGVRNEQII